MARQTEAKIERIIEAVRHGLEGLAAVEFIQKSGYAVTQTGIARHLRTLGGRGRVQDLINEGKSNLEIIECCYPAAELDELRKVPPLQGELFDEGPSTLFDIPEAPLYETAKLTIRIPTDLYEAIRLAARGENKTQNELIVDILTSALAQLPRHVE